MTSKLHSFLYTSRMTVALFWLNYLTISTLWNFISLEFFVVSVGSKSESSSPVKSAVKRKQRELVTTRDVAKHRRSSVGSQAIDNVSMRDLTFDTSVQSCADDSWADMETKAVDLRVLLEHERKQSDNFEAYLRQALAGSDCQISSPSARSRESVLNCSDRQQHSLTEKISLLQSSLISEREADRLFELQLLQICLYD